MQLKTAAAAKFAVSLWPLLPLLVAAATYLWSTQAYRSLAQEDGIIEWATFWAFLAAASIAFRSAIEARPRTLRVIYCAMFAIGCFLIAMEEISWGQRLFAYRPPERFLADNFQQEFNVHNLASTSHRKMILYTLLIGFGVVWPLAGRAGALGGWLKRTAVPVPAISSIVVFGVIASVYWAYPWTLTGEWVELMAGLAFLHAAIDIWTSDHPAAHSGRRLIGVGAAPFLLGYASTLLTFDFDAANNIQLARLETQALAADFANRRFDARCGIHKRVYTFKVQYGHRNIDNGAFARHMRDANVEHGRADYYLDPWNLAYWIRHACSQDRQAAFVYSFGPNKRRDSSRWEISGDDVGVYLVQRP